MALDGLVVRAIVRELAECVGGKINKIYQPSGYDLHLHIRTPGRSRKLLLSANPTYPRVHFTDQSALNPLEAPMFCMLLRKHCEGGVIEQIVQVGTERIIHIDVRQRDEIGDVSRKRIVVELMGRHSNIVLLDPSSGTILDGIHHITPAISSYRIILPGSTYTPPPAQGKLNPLETGREAFMAAMQPSDSAGDETPDEVGTSRPSTAAERLVSVFSGLSPLVAKEVVYRSGQNDPLNASDGLEALWHTFGRMMEELAAHRYIPAIYEDAGTSKLLFSVVALTQADTKVKSFESVSDCLEAYYGDKAERDTVKQRASDLLRFVQNERSKNLKKLEKLEASITEAAGADEYRIQGELLTASLHLMRKGDKTVEVVNYYDEQQRTVAIALDPQLSPSENAQRYFKKYTKLRNSLSVIREQIESANTEIAYMETLLAQLESASLADIEGIRDELVEQGYLRERGSRKRGPKKKKTDKPMLTCYTSREGIPIYVGKNNLQNEYVTNRLAQPNDTWLHTKDIPGSHVVIRSDAFGDETLQDAAMLAAYYSQAKSSSQVPVDYTLIRYVRKPNGSKPGFVIYDRQKTLYMTPDEQAIKAMAVTVK